MFMIRRIRRVSSTTSNPKIRASPLVGRRSVVRILISVVLPAPFGPSRPKNSPGATSRSTPASAVTAAGFASYTRRTPRTEMAGGRAAPWGATDMGSLGAVAGSGSVARMTPRWKTSVLHGRERYRTGSPGLLRPPEPDAHRPRREREPAVVPVEHEPRVRQDEVRRDVVEDLDEVGVGRQLALCDGRLEVPAEARDP